MFIVKYNEQERQFKEYEVAKTFITLEKVQTYEIWQDIDGYRINITDTKPYVFKAFNSALDNFPVLNPNHTLNESRHEQKLKKLFSEIRKDF